MRNWTRMTTPAVAALVVAGAAFALGRATAPDAAHHGQDTAAVDYLDGLRAGRAEGRLEGRAEQEGTALPAGDRAPVQNAFTAGYTAGANDAFAGYDGGWTLGVPWIVTLEDGPGGIAYRITHRTPVEAGTDYYLCPDGSALCQRPR